MLAPARPSRRAVITGVGVVSPIGNSKEHFWQSLAEGRCGISHTSLQGGSSASAGEVKQFRGQVEDFGDLDKNAARSLRKALKVMSRETQMAVFAAQQAISDSCVAEAGLDPERVGVCFGAGNVSLMPQDFLAAIRSCTDRDDAFDARRWGSDGIPQIEPLWLLKCMPNMPACHIAVLNNLCGPNNSITQRDVSANLAVAEACHLIMDDEADMVVTGATGTTILPVNMIHTLLETQVASASRNPWELCRPFDRDRDGTVLGEAAAALVVEERSQAIRRGARIYGEVSGVGSSCVARRNGRADCAQALAGALRLALRGDRPTSGQIGHIHAHGLSTISSDIHEARAIRAVFGKEADRLPIVAAKSYTGCAGAGSGAVELVASLLALEKGCLFPVLNYKNPDENCPISPVTSCDVEAGESFVNLSFTQDGRASCLLVSAFS